MIPHSVTYYPQDSRVSTGERKSQRWEGTGMEEACGSTCDSHSCRLSRPASLRGIGALVAWSQHLGGPLGGWPLCSWIQGADAAGVCRRRRIGGHLSRLGGYSSSLVQVLETSHLPTSQGSSPLPIPHSGSLLGGPELPRELLPQGVA